MIGACARRAWRTKRTKEKTARPSSESVHGDVSPCPCTLVMPSMAQSVARPSVPAPNQSKRLFFSSRGCGSKAIPATPAIRQKGRLARMIASQPKRSSSMPPSVGATAGASTMLKPRMPEARPCDSTGKRRITATAPSGCRMPAAAPCTMRMATSQAKLVASAPSALLTASTAMAPRKQRRKPMRSSSQGVGSMDRVIAAMKPVIAHCTLSWPRPNCRPMLGMATFMLLVDSTPAMPPKATANRTSHL